MSNKLEEIWEMIRSFDYAGYWRDHIASEFGGEAGIKALLNESWFFWGAFIVVALPLLILLVGELVHRANRSGSPMVTMWRSLRNLVLPTLGLLLLMEHVLKDPPILGKRIVTTFFWVFVLNTSLALVNGFLLNDNDPDSWRSKVPKLVLDMSRFFLVLVGAAFVLSAVWEQNLGQLLTALGVGSIVLGLALQDTLGALFSGVALISGRAFAVGDWVQIEATEGEVIGMTWRTVSLQTRDGDLIVVPNGTLAKREFTNYSRPDQVHGEKVELDFHFRDEPNRVHQILREAALSTPGVLQTPEPEVHTLSYNVFSIRYELQVWMENYFEMPDVRSDLMTRIYYVAKRNGLTWPTPQREVYNFDGAQLRPPETIEERLSLIRALGFYEGDEAELRQLAEASQILDFGAGETIVPQEERGGSFFVLSKGRAEVFYTDKFGGRYDLHRLARGEFFGEASLLRSEYSASTVVAVGDVQVLAIAPKAINTLLDAQPAFAKEIEEIIQGRKSAASRIQDMVARLEGDGERADSGGGSDRLLLLQSARELFESKTS